jgi:hypothetical protein
VKVAQSGAALISVYNYDKSAVLKIGRDLNRLGFDCTPSGTRCFFKKVGLP